MRVLLVNSPLGRSQPPVFPLGLAYMASVLEDHEVTCFDAATSEAPFQELKETVNRSQPEVIGLSLRNIDTLVSSDIFSYWPAFVTTVRFMREQCPNAVLVAGGAGFSIFAQAILESLPELDFGVLLEGESTFPELLGHLDQPDSVKGLYYRRDGQVLFSGARHLLNLDSIPFPRRDILDLAVYKGVNSFGVQTKRGCPYECLYCTYPFLTGGRVRLRSPESVGEELEILSKEYHRNEFFFADNVFNQPLSHAEAVCEEILRRKLDIRWTAYFSEEGITPAFAKLALDSGCVKFNFAPDGSNDASLKKLGKRVSRQQLESVYRLLDGLAGAKFACGFIWNYPRVDWRDLRDLLSLVFLLMRSKNMSGMGFTAMRILPNTRLYEVALEQGYVRLEDDLLSPIYYDPYPWHVITVLARSLRKLHTLRVLTALSTGFRKLPGMIRVNTQGSSS